MKVGITHGDYNGANYEILFKIFEDPRMAEDFTPVVYGSPRVATWYRKALNNPAVQMNYVETIDNIKEGTVNLVNVIGPAEPEITPGVASKEAGEVARKALERAVADLKEGKIDVLVTMPINKDTVQSEEFHFPGHTEYLESVLADGDENKALMVLCSDNMRVALVTTHSPVSEVAAKITEDAVLEKLRVFNRTLEMDFSLHGPRIAVLALNPHAGENGILGKEEAEVIAPAIEKAYKEGILAFGPYAADGFFGSGNYRKFDGILAMYHDQGLIPFKMLSMDDGVNFTAGLPFVRTSPDHGTAYDIAGKNIASPDSARTAIYRAIDFKRNRDANKELLANPLQKHYNTTPNNRD